MTVVRQSKAFIPVRREDPKDEEFTNAKLLIRAGFVEKLHAGVYTYLPLGLRVIRQIEGIIREEMDALSGQELLMPALHPKAPWEKTGRWADFNVLYRLKDSSNKDLALGPTHEEVIVPLVQHAISSYRDLPLALYQFQTKFRDEPRPKSGLLRGKEFLMKDLYSFHESENDFVMFYEQMKGAYRTIFERLGLGEKTVLTYASGGTFSPYSHEFQTIAAVGEDTIYVCNQCRMAVNAEMRDTQKTCPSCDRPLSELSKERAIEVGNIFPLKTKFAEAFGLTFRDADGNEQLVLMGCYGIGLGRAMAAVVETSHDERGVVWPDVIAPFRVHLLALGPDADVFSEAERFGASLQEAGISVLYDDRRDVRPGEKLATADLLGIPWRIVLSKKTLADKKAEVKRRTEKEAALMPFTDVIKKLSTRP